MTDLVSKYAPPGDVFRGKSELPINNDLQLLQDRTLMPFYLD